MKPPITIYFRPIGFNDHIIKEQIEKVNEEFVAFYSIVFVF